jgi:hypothetical protein
VRKDLSQNCFEMPERKVERNGKAYTMDTSNIGTKRKDTSNIIPSPVPFQKQEPADDYDDVRFC